MQTFGAINAMRADLLARAEEFVGVLRRVPDELRRIGDAVLDRLFIAESIAPC